MESKKVFFRGSVVCAVFGFPQRHPKFMVNSEFPGNERAHILNTVFKALLKMRFCLIFSFFPLRSAMLWYVHLFCWRVINSHPQTFVAHLSVFFSETNTSDCFCCQGQQASFFYQDGCTNTFLCECRGWAFHSSYWWVCQGLSQDEPQWYGLVSKKKRLGKIRKPTKSLADI